jgi:hypothetical protein
MRSRKILLGLLLAAALTLASVAIWLWAEAASRPSLEARIAEAHSRAQAAKTRFCRLVVIDAPGEELDRAAVEMNQAEQEERELGLQQYLSWQARLRREIRHRTGW